MPPAPHPNAYWVHDQLLASEYPGALTEACARTKIGALLDAGVTAFVDLTEPGELHPYEEILYDEAAARRVFAVYRRFPIRDLSVPTPEGMRALLDALDGLITEGHIACVHCWGGVGRTGTVVGCHLVRRGQQGEAALAHIAERWKTVEKVHRMPRSPETEAQRAFVRGWREP